MGKKTTTQEMKMPEFQQEFLTSTVIPTAERLASTPFTPYTGTRVADLTGLQRQALSGYGGLDMGTPAFAQAADVYSTIAGEGISPERIQSFMSPYTQEVIDASMRDIGRQRDIALNQLGTAASQAGAFGGSRQGIAEAETQRAFAETAADTAARLREAGYTQAAGMAQADLAQRMAAAQGGIGAAGAGLQQQVAGLGAQMAAGEAERVLGQQALDALYEQYMLQQQYPLTQFGVLTGAAGAVPSGYGTTTKTERDPMGTLGGVLGGIGSAGQGAWRDGLHAVLRRTPERKHPALGPSGRFQSLHLGLERRGHRRRRRGYAYVWRDRAGVGADPPRIRHHGRGRIPPR